MPTGISEIASPSSDQERFDWCSFLPLLVIAAGLLAYLSSFGGVFLFDDRRHVIEENRLVDLWPLWEVLARRRPVIDYSLALNYFFGGLDPWGYHAVNVGVHLLAALTLYGVIRRTLLRCAIAGRSAAYLAAAVALIWVVHPLGTQAVTYIIQRCESMMGLFYLLTLYCMIRGVDSSRSRWWYLWAVVSCALGMGSKAIMVTAPIMVFFYDRVFVSRSFAGALRQRWGFYLFLASTWSILWITGVAPAVLDPSNYRSNVGFGVQGVTPIEYAQTQFGVILHYLRLSLWPHPLCLDYHWPMPRPLGEIILPGIAVLILLGGTIWAWLRRSWLGFVGVWFFIILAPTSSFVPIRDPIFEHRMYLPLAAVITLVVVSTHFALLLFARRRSWSGSSRRRVAVVLTLAVAVALACTTTRRNLLYHNEVAMWRDVRSTQPASPRAAENLGTTLLAENKMAEAAAVLQEAIELNPDSARCYSSFGFALIALNRREQAVAAFETAIELQPSFAQARRNLALALVDLGRPEEAVPHLEEVLGANPGDNEARFALGNILLSQGRLDEAIAQYTLIVRVQPDYSSAWTNLGSAILNKTQMEAARKREPMDQAMLGEAERAFRTALKLDSDSTNAHNSLGIVLANRGELDGAIEAFRQALLLQPNFASAHYNLANCLVDKGDLDGAIRQFVAAIRLKPNDSTYHFELGVVLTRSGSLNEAAKAFQRTLQLNPNHTRAQKALDAIRAKPRGSAP